MKIAKACRSCRVGKRKCVTKTSSTSCTQCVRRNQTCSLETKPRVGSRILPAPTADGSTSQWQYSPHLSIAETRELVTTYFRLIHDKPHSLFLQPTFLKQFEDGTLEETVILGAIGLAIRVFEPQRPPALIECVANQAKTALKLNIDRVSLANIQACILVGNIYAAEGNHEAESLFFSIGITMAQVLRLRDSSPTDGEINHEIRSRVWCSLYMIDCWSSSGNNLPRRLLDRSMVSQPMDEVVFDRLVAGHDPNIRSLTGPGMWSFMIQLANIFSAIQEFHQDLAGGLIGNTKAQGIATKLASELDEFDQSLPDCLRLSSENVKVQAVRGVGATFVALHPGYHYYAMLLYFPFIDRRFEPTQASLDFSYKCKTHAAEFSDLLQLSSEVEGCRAVYFIVAHMAVVSSAVMIHTLLMGDEIELPSACQRLESNFVALIDLRNKWPAVASLMSRLFTFQRSCLWEADGNTHKVDSWMIVFLLNHGLPLSEKSQLAESPGSWDQGLSAEVLERGKVANGALAMLTQVMRTQSKTVSDSSPI